MSEEIKILIVVNPQGPSDWMRDCKERDQEREVLAILKEQVSFLVKTIKEKCGIETEIDIESPSNMGLFWEMTVDNSNDV